MARGRPRHAGDLAFVVAVVLDLQRVVAVHIPAAATAGAATETPSPGIRGGRVGIPIDDVGKDAGIDAVGDDMGRCRRRCVENVLDQAVRLARDVADLAVSAPLAEVETVGDAHLMRERRFETGIHEHVGQRHDQPRRCRS